MAKILGLHKFFSTKLEKVLNFAYKKKDKIGGLLMREQAEPGLRRLRGNTHTSRPLGSDSFLSKLEATLGRRLRPLPVGKPIKKHNVLKKNKK